MLKRVGFGEELGVLQHRQYSRQYIDDKKIYIIYMTATVLKRICKHATGIPFNPLNDHNDVMQLKVKYINI